MTFSADDLWNAASKFSDERQKESDRKNKRKKINDLKCKQCGHCEHSCKTDCAFGKSSHTGYTKYPKISDLPEMYGCQKFKRSFWIEDLIKELTKELMEENK